MPDSHPLKTEEAEKMRKLTLPENDLEGTAIDIGMGNLSRNGEKSRKWLMNNVKKGGDHARLKSLQKD